MIIEAQDTKSGRSFCAEAPELDERVKNDFFNTFCVSDEDLKRWMDSLDVSADAKAVLHKIGQANIRAGGLVVRIGRKTLDVIGFLLREFPFMTFGAIFGAVVGALVITIPVIGFVIGPSFKAFAIAAGMALGLIEDKMEKSIKRCVQEAILSFEKLRTE